jgi:hypothetical protein
MKYVHLTGDIVDFVMDVDPKTVFDDFYASGFVSTTQLDVDVGWVATKDGSFVAPLPLPVVIPQSITPRQIRLQLSAIGMRQAVEDYVASASLEIKDWWEFSLAYERNAPLLIEAATTLGMTGEQLDQFFIEANKL